MTDTYLWLLDMPSAVLHGEARGIEQWCLEHGRMRPTLLDLCLARAARPRR